MDTEDLSNTAVAQKGDRVDLTVWRKAEEEPDVGQTLSKLTIRL